MELMEAVDQWIPNPQREIEKPFLMAISNTLHIPQRGIFADGIVERGVLRMGDKVEIIGVHEEGRETVITSMQKFREMRDEAKAGESIGVMLREIPGYDIEVGQVLVKPGTARACKRFIARVYVPAGGECAREAPLVNKHRLHFYFRTAEVTGVCSLPEGVGVCMPGDSMEMTIEVSYPVPMERGLPFPIYDGERRFAVGKVVDIIE